MTRRLGWLIKLTPQLNAGICTANGDRTGRVVEVRNAQFLYNEGNRGLLPMLNDLLNRFQGLEIWTDRLNVLGRCSAVRPTLLMQGIYKWMIVHVLCNSKSRNHEGIYWAINILILDIVAFTSNSFFFEDMLVSNGLGCRRYCGAFSPSYKTKENSAW